VSSTSSDGQPPAVADTVRDQVPSAPVCFRHPDRETYLRCHRCERSICTDCMIPAAVGHQCPECVRGGAKTVREPRTAAGGRMHSRQGMVTIGLIALNVLMFGLQQLIGQAFTVRLELLGIAGSSAATPSAVNIGVANGEWYRLLTAMFVHENVAHIGLNMLSLWWIGVPVEARLGRLRYFLTYLVCGVGASAVSFAFMGRYDASLGASGAIFGLLGVLAVMAYREKLDMRPIVVVIVLNLAFSFSVPGIDWHDHLGGLACGLLMGVAFGYAPRVRQRTVWYRNPQTLVPLGGGLLILVLTVVLVVVHSQTLQNSALAAASAAFSLVH
jgi:membrane associated rhomboid family serine protease